MDKKRLVAEDAVQQSKDEATIQVSYFCSITGSVWQTLRRDCHRPAELADHWKKDYYQTYATV